MDPIVTGALVGAGSSLLGGVLGRSSSNRVAREQMAMQREFAQMGIRWKVEDAKAAGLHPLFALGANTPSYSPVQNVDPMGAALAEAGQSVGRAVASQETVSQRALSEAQLRGANALADKHEAEAALARSEIVRRSQAGPPMPGVSSSESGSAGLGVVQSPPVVQLPPEMDIPGQHDVVQIKPSEVTSSASDRPHVAAGGPAGAPASREYRLTPNMKVLLPAANDLGEALEPLSESWILMYTWYRLNVQEYGEHLADLAFQELGLPVTLLKGARRVGKGLEGLDFSGLRPSVRFTGPRPSGGAYFGR